jgi:cytochrome P450
MASLDIKSIKDTKLGKFNFKKEDIFSVMIEDLHLNPEQWQRPEEYLPERWESGNPLGKTPSGHKRHPMSYIPFLSGPRNCLG